MTIIDRRSFVAGSVGVLTSASLAKAQSFPAQELSWLIYQSPGGSVDVTTRIIASGLERAGLKIKLEYAQGAGGRVARSKLFNSKPDGYTLMTDVAPGAIVDQNLFKVPYKVGDFEPIYGWILNGFHYCTKKDSSIRTFEDFVSESKKRRLSVGTIGRGSAQHLHIVAMRAKLGLSFNIVHFDGSSPLYTAVLGGHIDIGGGGAGSGSRQERVLNFLAVTGTKREKALASTPTVRELGFEVPAVEQLYFANTSPNVPEDRVLILTRAFSAALKDPEVVSKLEAGGDFTTLLNPMEIKQLHSAQERLLEEYKDELRK